MNSLPPSRLSSASSSALEQSMLSSPDCVEIDPGSASIHSGASPPPPPPPSSASATYSGVALSGLNRQSKQPPGSLPIMPMPDVGKVDQLDGHRMFVRGFAATPPPSSAGPTSAAAAAFVPPADSASPDGPWNGTSWTGGITQGCAPTAALFRSSSVDTVTTCATGKRTATTSVPGGGGGGGAMSPATSAGGVSPRSPNTPNKLESIKNWTISTYKCSRQSLFEKLGKTSRTVDAELETQIETLRDTQRKYSNILRLARALTSHFYHVVQTQNSLGECFNDLAHKSPELQDEFLYNAETQRKLSKNGDVLIAALHAFVSSVNTLCNKTMEDTIATVKQYETARVEFDAYRCDLEYYQLAPKTEANEAKLNEVGAMFNKQKLEFEKLRSDVQIKLKFLDENRVKVMHKQLLLFHNAVSAYFSGNQAALDATIAQFSIKLTSPNAAPHSWIEQ